MKSNEFDTYYIQELDYVLDQLSKVENVLTDLFFECSNDDPRNDLIQNCMRSLVLSSKVCFVALNYEDYDM